MKKLLVLSLLACLQFDVSEAQTVDAQTCQRTYATSVSACAQSLNALAPNVRAAAQKACVQDAMTARDLCKNGNVSQCQTNCQTAYSATVATCESEFNSQVLLCGENVLCKDIATEVRSQCISVATNSLNACVAGCQIQ